MPQQQWRVLCSCRHELNISLSLRCGQAFGWRPTNKDATAFVGTVSVLVFVCVCVCVCVFTGTLAPPGFEKGNQVGSSVVHECVYDCA